MSKNSYRCGSLGRFRLAAIAWLLCAGLAVALGHCAEQIDVAVARSQSTELVDGLWMRVRLTAITPAEPSPIHWRYGGEGQGGDLIRGLFAKPGAEENDSHELALGEWSSWTPFSSLARGRLPEMFFLTITAGQPGRVVDRLTGRRGEYSTDARFEIEFRYRDKVIQRLVEHGPDGGTVTVVIPLYRLAQGTPPDDPQFVAELTGVLQYATRRAEFLETLPWARGPLPRKYLLINNISGYGTGSGYGIRTTDKAVTWAELRSLRQLGVNGLRTPPEFLIDLLRNGDPRTAPFRRGLLMPMMGFPVPAYRAGRPVDPEAGCPFAAGVAERTRAAVDDSLTAVLDLPVDEVWGLTVDEIGAVVDLAPEGKAHLAVCPRCAAAFRAWLKAKGLQASDFGQQDFSAVRPLDVWQTEGPRPWLSDPGAALTAYWTRDFNNYATAQLFTPLRNAVASANQRKRRQLAEGEQQSAAAGQPWVYSFALRGNTFLMKGHSLDFFDFYRHADNAIVYETSNRDPRIWSWDSYLCDVQRVVAERMGLARGIYIKPHRGAPLQRMLAAVSRGNTMIYWYTYGPDYHKGDSFSQNREVLALTSKAAHLLGAAEEVLYESSWMLPAEIALVKPETTQRWMNLLGDPPHVAAAWENAKWVYTALQHAHLPVDPLDEQMLATADLSPYKAIYVNGSHLTRAAAEALMRYVAAGGTLYTSGWGLVRDEANQPLRQLEPVLGLRGRREPEMWYRVQLYGAGTIEPYDDPRNQLAPPPVGARLLGGRIFEASFVPLVGREILDPQEDAEVLARFADGTAAVVRHRYGKGQAYVVALFPGLEYSAPVRVPEYNMRAAFSAARRSLIAAPALALTAPVVDASDPLVEGVLLRSAAGTQRAVTLANWAYEARTTSADAQGRQRTLIAHLPIEHLKVTIRGAGPVARATSCVLHQQLEVATSGETVTFTLPRLEEGDVVVLE